MNRRLLTAALPLALIATRCAVTSTNGVTTATLDTAKVDTDGQAVATIAQTIMATPAITTVLGTDLTATGQSALQGIKTALADFDAATAGKVSVSIDTTSVTNLVNSLITDAHTVVNLAQQTAPKLSASDAASVNLWTSAILTLLPFIQLAIGLAGAKPLTQAPLMSEQDALGVARGVRHP